MIGVFGQFLIYAIGFCFLLLAAIFALHGLDRIIVKRWEDKHRER